MSVYKYTLQNGKVRWYYTTYYTDWMGKRKRKKQEGFLTQREAKEAEAEFLNSAKMDSEITFGNLVNAYLDNHRSRTRDTTRVTHENIIRSKIVPYFKHLPIGEIDAAMVMKWQNELMNYRNPKTGKPYSDTYLRQIHNRLSTIFNFAIKYYGLTKNPAQLCGSMGKQNAEKFDFWTHDEFEKFIMAAREDIRAYVIFNLLFFGGMRMGELLAFSLNDFDFEKNTISISKSLATVHGKQVIGEPKTQKSNRVIAMPTQIMDMVKEYAASLYDYKPDQLLFRITKSSLHREMKKYCDISGIRKIKIHELRHSHASHLIELGVSPLTISERLGHEDIKTTLNTYSHLYPNKQSEIADMLSEYIV